LNLELARSNMIEQQIRTWKVLDHRVLEVMREVPREDFVPARHRKLAFSDLRIPLGHDQVMMKPIEQGRMLQGLNLAGHERVLEVGTGSGFITACLARLAGSVLSIEILESLARQARTNLESFDDIELKSGDIFDADFSTGEFDAIVVTAAGDHIPPPLVRQLKPGGRMVIPVGSGFLTQQLLLVTKRPDGGIETRELLPVAFVPLTGGH